MSSRFREHAKGKPATVSIETEGRWPVNFSCHYSALGYHAVGPLKKKCSCKSGLSSSFLRSVNLMKFFLLKKSNFLQAHVSGLLLNGRFVDPILLVDRSKPQ